MGCGASSVGDKPLSFKPSDTRCMDSELESDLSVPLSSAVIVTKSERTLSTRRWTQLRNSHKELVATTSDAVFRVKSAIESAIDINKQEAVNTLQRQRSSISMEEHLSQISDERMMHLKGCIFVGHIATDLDSIAGAIGAAHLYDGTAARASELNSETRFALERWGFAVPPKVEDVLKEDSRVCLVDFQQVTQLNPAINASQVVGIIDHHALQNATIVTNSPIYVDIRPWGSMSSIIAHTFLDVNRTLPKEYASDAASSILIATPPSPTVSYTTIPHCTLARLPWSNAASSLLAKNSHPVMQSPTSTDTDALMVGVLSRIAAVTDTNQYAKEQFKAKSADLSTLSEASILIGDFKRFKCGVGAEVWVGFGVVETTDPEAMQARIPALLKEIPHCKKEQNVDVLFFAIVDIVGMQSDLLCCGPREIALAAETFADCTMQTDSVINMGKKVSRKKDFIPPLTAVLNKGFDLPNESFELEETVLHMDENTNGCLVRTLSKSNVDH